MKVKEIGSGTPYDSWTGGRLNPAYHEIYAQYFVKFIETFRDAGIPIYAVTPQNEPLHSGNCASLYLPWEDEAALISHMAPAFKRAGLPLTHTQGYNPRPSVSIALPLSVGVESVCELLDFDLYGDKIDNAVILEKLYNPPYSFVG